MKRALIGWWMFGAVAACGARSRAPIEPDAGTPVEAPPEQDPPDPWEPPPRDPCVAPDRDYDGHDAIECGGDDCDDHAHFVHPDAADQETGWQEHLFDEGEVVCCSTSLAIDAAGRVHVAYYGENELRYLRIDDATSDRVEAIRENVANAGPPGSGYAAMALDPTGAAHLAHLYLTGFGHDDVGVLQYSTNASGEWETEVVDASGDVGYEPAIAIDATGRLHVVHYDAIGRDLEYARQSGGEWTLETIESDGDVGHDPSVAIGPDGFVHVVYYDSDDGDLRHATDAFGGWSIETIDGADGDTGRYTEIAIAPSGTIHVGYQDWDAKTLRWAHGAWGDWTIETVDDTVETGWGGAIALDADEQPHFSYTHVIAWGRDETLRYATKSGGRWQIQDWDAGLHGGMYTSIGVDDRGPHITHIDKGFLNLGYFFVGRADGMDQNCDGVDGTDGDGDGFASTGSGGADCDDASPETNPDAEDVPNDGVDQDCDGST